MHKIIPYKNGNCICLGGHLYCLEVLPFFHDIERTPELLKYNAHRAFNPIRVQIVFHISTKVLNFKKVAFLKRIGIRCYS